MSATILMPVLNGAGHLPEQLDSLGRQTVPPAALVVSDDGSADGSRAVVRAFAARAPFEVRLRRGPGRGYAANVMALLEDAPDGAVIFSDQDDIWATDRLERGLTAIGGLNAPALHVAARQVFGRRTYRGERTLIPPPCPFATALVQNVAPANATLMNAAAAHVIRRAAARLSAPPPFPDWWIYGLITGIGSEVVHDHACGVHYREHAGNLLGSIRSCAGVRRRIGYMLNGTYGLWLRQNTRALEEVADLFTPEARTRLYAFSRALAAGRSRDWLALSSRTGGGEKLLLRGAAGLGLI